MPKKTVKPDKIAELTADLQRERAEFHNFRRRAEVQRAELTDFVKQDVVLQLLPLIDNLDRALSHLTQDLAGNPWAEGVAKVAKQAEETLKSLGIERIESIGQPFDHHLHEAVGVEGDGHDEIVAEELRPGYRLGDKIIRHAIVKVERK